MTINSLLLIVIIYIALMFVVSGWAAMRQRKAKSTGQTADDFLLAGRSLPFYLVGFMIAGSAIGGVSTVGVAQNAFFAGLSAGFYNVAWAIGALFSAIYIVQRIRATGFATPNQMYRAVYGDKFGTVTLLVFVCSMTLNIANQLVSAGSVLTGILPGLFDLTTAMIISIVLFIGIAFIGGMYGASVTNLVNVIVIYIGTVAAAISLLVTNGGPSGLSEMLPAGDHWWHLTKGMGTATIVAWIINMTVSGINSGSIFQSVVSCRSPKESRKGVLFACLLIAPAGFMCAILGIGARALFPNLENAKLALPTILSTVPEWAAGLCLAGLWAAVVSTAVAIIMGVALMITKDIVVKLFKPNMDESTQVKVSRIVMVLLGVFALFAALRLINVISTMMAALSLMSPLALLMITFLLLPPKYSRKSTCWWVWGLGTIAYLSCTFINTGWKILGQAVYTTLLFSLLGYIISLVVDKRLAREIEYSESLDQ